MSDSVGSVSVDVVPDARGWAEKLRAQIRDQTVTVQAEADTTEANAKLDEAARTRTAKIKADVDKSALSRFDKFLGGLSSLPALAIAAGSALIPLAGALGGVVAALAAPLAIVGAGGTLYAFLAGAAVKQTEEQKKKIDTLAKAVETAKASLANTQAAAQSSASQSTATAHASAAASLKSAQQSAANSIRAARQAEAAATTAAGRQAARDRIAAAQRTLAQRTAAIDASVSSRQSAITASQSASVEAAQRKVNEATKAYKDALHALSPEQQKFLDAQSKLKSAFQNFIDKTGPALLGPLTQGLGFLTRLLPSLQPIVGAFGTALKGIFDQLGRASESHGFETFVQRFAHQLGPDLHAFAGILGNLAKGVGELFLTIDHKSGGQGMLRTIEGLTQNFSKWADSRAARHDVQDFFDYAHRVGPQVAHAIGAVARALGQVVQALAPLGPGVLHGLQLAANGLSAIPIPVLTALAAAFAGLVGFQKLGGFKVASFLTKIVGGGERGSSPAKPLFVLDVNGGGKGGVDALGGKAGFFAKWTERLLPAALGGGAISAPEAGAMGGLFVIGSVAQGILIHKLMTSANQWAKGRSTPMLGHPSGPDETPWQIAQAPHLNYAELYPGIYGPKAATDHLDAIRAHIGQASRQLDLIGPHADAAFGRATKDLRGFVSELAGIHTKDVLVRLQDQAAIQSLEALDRMRLHAKSLNIYANYQAIERAPGLGGGMGQLPHGSAGSGSGSGAGRAGPTYTGPIHVRAHDYRDFTQQMEARHRRSSLDGVG